MGTAFERLIRPSGDQLIRGLFGYGGNLQDIDNQDFMSNVVPGGFTSAVGPAFQRGVSGDAYVQNPYLGFATQDAGQRFYDWQTSWNRRFATDAVDSQGNVQAPSAVTGTGQRMNRQFGGFANGGPQSVQSTDLWGGMFGDGGQASQYTSGSGLAGQYYDPSAWGAAMRGDTGAYQSAVSGNPYSDPNRWLADSAPLAGNYQGAVSQNPYSDPSRWVSDSNPLASQYRDFMTQNPYSDPTRWSGDLDPLNQGRRQDMGQYSPEAAARGAFDLAEARRAAGYDPVALAREGIGMGRGVDQQSLSDMTAAIDQETQRSLALQLPEVQAQAQMLGLTDGAAAQRLGGDVARDVAGQGAREKAKLIAQFQNDAANRQNALIQNFQQLGAGAGEGLFNQASSLYGQQYGARENALNNVYNTTAGALGRGQSSAFDAANQMGANIFSGQMGLLGRGQSSAYDAANQMAGNIFSGQMGMLGQGQNASYAAQTGMARDIMNAQTGATLAGMNSNMDRGNMMAQLAGNMGLGIMGQVTNRMGMEDDAQNRATRTWMDLMNSQDTMHDGRMGNLLAMSGLQQNDLQGRNNMQLNYGMMPMNWLMNLVTGTPQTSSYMPGQNNWMSLLGGVAGPAAQYGFNMINTGPTPGANPYDT